MDVVQLYSASNPIAQFHLDLIASSLWVHGKIALQTDGVRSYRDKMLLWVRHFRRARYELRCRRARACRRLCELVNAWRGGRCYEMTFCFRISEPSVIARRQ